MNKQPTTEYVTRTYLSFRPVLRTGYKRVRARGRSTKESGEADTCRAEVLLRDHSSMVQGRNARGVGYCAALCLFLVTGGYPSPPSFWSNICPRKNKSLLSLTTGRASLVSNRALFNRRRITDPESIQAPYSLSLSLSCSPVSSPEPSLLLVFLVVFLSRVSLVVPYAPCLLLFEFVHRWRFWDRDNCSMYIEYLWINSSSAFDNFFLFSLRCSCSVSFEAVFLFLNPAYFCFSKLFWNRRWLLKLR